MKLAMILVVIAMLAACGGGAPTPEEASEAAAAEEAFALKNCEIGGDTYGSVTVFIDVAPNQPYEAEAMVTLHRKGDGPTEKYPVQFFVRKDSTRVYLVPGMKKGSDHYKSCEAELVSVTAV